MRPLCQGDIKSEQEKLEMSVASGESHELIQAELKAAKQRAVLSEDNFEAKSQLVIAAKNELVTTHPHGPTPQPSSLSCREPPRGRR